MARIYRNEQEIQGERAYIYVRDAHAVFSSHAARIRRLSPCTTRDLLDIRDGVKGEYDKLVAFNNTHGSGGSNWFQSEYGTTWQTKLDEIIAAMVTINGAWNLLLDNYEAPSGNVEIVAMSAVDQEAAAVAVDTELEA